MPVRLPRSLAVVAATVVGGAAMVAAGPAGAGLPAGYTVTDGVEVIEVVVTGAQGGGVDLGEFSTFGGTGCRVQASLEVEAGDNVNWINGGMGDGTLPSVLAGSGGVGGAGARPGGRGGATVTVFGTPAPGAGGGGATSLSVNGEELVVAAGGGGGSGTTSGGGGCSGNGPEGGQGFGSSPTARGGSTPEAGGAGGLGNDGSATPPPGGNGNSATDSPPGLGGVGGEGRFGGPGGGGGGGGISGGGGGAGQNGQFGGGNGTGAAGLSGAPTPPAGIAAPRFSGGPEGNGSSAVFAVVVATDELDTATAGTAYTASLDAALELASAPGFAWSAAAALPAADGDVVWSLAPGSDPLPGGLTLTASGSISGTPTAAGNAALVLAAEVVDGSGDTRARTIVALDLVVAGSAPTSSTTPTTEPTTTTAAPTATTTGGRAGTLPATGASSVAPLVTTALLLAGSGVGAALVARRRRT